MKGRSRWLTFILWNALCVVCMCVLLLCSSQKSIAIAEVTPGWADEGPAGGEETALPLIQDDSIQGRFHIPLPEGLGADKVVIENRYMEGELWIRVQGEVDEQYYLTHEVCGDITHVEDAGYQTAEGGLLLKFKMTELLEYRSIREENSLCLEYLHPNETYDRIIVVDPCWREEETVFYDKGVTEKEMSLGIAQALKKKLEKQNIKVYFTRLDDRPVSVAQRVWLANNAGVDMYIGLQAAKDDKNSDTFGISCLYNGDYYIPVFGNVELADTLEWNVTKTVNGKALGLAEAGEDSILELLKVPAAIIQTGYLTNQQESELLSQVSYQEKIADGIGEAVMEAYGILEADSFAKAKGVFK